MTASGPRRWGGLYLAYAAGACWNASTKTKLAHSDICV